MKIEPKDIKSICQLIYNICGIVLDETKGYLIKSRLGKIAEDFGCHSFTELCQKCKYSNDNTIRNAIISGITTNETLFFRDTSPFEGLRYKIIPELIDSKEHTKNPRKLRIWSAACSTGQEPYSLAIMLTEMIPDISQWNITIKATDISEAALLQAGKGEFPLHDIERGLKPELLDKYFTKKNNIYKINDEIRYLIQFSRNNLMEPFQNVEPFDIVLCRNVAIYFNPEAREDLFKRIVKVISPTGYLIVGTAEDLSMFGEAFKPQLHCQSTFYQPNINTLAAMT